MPDLEALIAKCKCGVHLTVNGHRDYYESAEYYLQREGQREVDAGCDDWASPEVVRQMIERDTIIELQFYPETPIGFYKVWHYDLSQAVADALGVINA